MELSNPEPFGLGLFLCLGFIVDTIFQCFKKKIKKSAYKFKRLYDILILVS